MSCENCQDTKIKREKCILIRSTFLETNNISGSENLGYLEQQFTNI